MLWLVLGPVTDWAAGDRVWTLPPDQEAAAVNAVRQTLLQAVGGTAALSALVFTATNYLLNRRGQFTERYAVAIGQLASEQLAERIGGIYALEHLMRESERDHTTVVEVLAAFVRENAPVDDTAAPAPKGDRDRWMHPPAGTPDDPSAERSAARVATDVQTALTVLARRPNRPEPNPVDLRSTDLRGANLVGARLEAVLLVGAHLEHAYLGGARLEHAYLGGAHLEHARLGGAHLEQANLWGARLEHAYLGGAHLEHAHLGGAHLEHAYLGGAHLEHAYLGGAHLEHANLGDAHLEQANLGGADLAWADLWSAHLAGADLRMARLEGVRGLTAEQLASAITGEVSGGGAG
ncbi:uncharacterized protein YjbI with pentapeptide repeats [Allonocardiopsis opalescens]|uniref:Uncharacterized protein YjbI with pentapeptide repeats n=1 Tax=Allonocardiopsis opalescens TaxID=1144618 RepID=A0A2T0Q9H9_9ACTN|nr:uncharacterized protein YjbI with pentapeptide repeats [Allonocardiopsis opalescens]